MLFKLNLCIDRYMAPIKRPFKTKIAEPKIFKHPTIGKNKYSLYLKNVSKLGEKEVGLYSFPGQGIRDISFGREKTHVNFSHKRIEFLYHTFSEHYPKDIAKEIISRASLLHTHVIEENKLGTGKEVLTALPSHLDIVETIGHYKKTKHSYDIIGVVDEHGKDCGYTVLKINKEKLKNIMKSISFEKPNSKSRSVLNWNPIVQYIDKVANKKMGHGIKTSIDMYRILPEIGFEIYFTPMHGYKLDNKFNYIKE